MEVSQQSDHVTHAVLGKQESVQMGVSNSATLMHVLSTALYTHPMLAAVREILCNGWDGHIISGNTDTPLQITIDDQFIRIRDFGPGIPHEKIGEIYGTYGNSTKRHDGEQTGGFGLGSKAPFAYTDNFEVINHHGGEKIIYRVSKSSMAAGGSPTIDTIVKLPSTETGIQVSMNIANSRDRDKFVELVKEVCLLGEIKAVLNGDENQLDRLPLVESPTGYIINSAGGTNLSTINVRYGNVVYPIPELETYKDIWGSVRRVIFGLWGGANVIFMAPPNTITIAPSREALIFTEGTIATVKGLLAKFNPDHAKASQVTGRQISNRQINQKIPHERLYLPGDLKQRMQLVAERGTSQTIASGPYNYDARKAAVSFAISRRSLEVEPGRLIFKRLKNAIYHKLVDKTKGKHFLRAAQKHQAFISGKIPSHGGHRSSYRASQVADSYLRAALHRYHTWPLMDAINAHDFMDKNDIHYVTQAHEGWEHSLRSPYHVVVGSATNLFGFLTPRILLARSKKAIKEFLNNRRIEHEPYRDLSGWMVYQLPKSDKHYAEIQKVFTDLGYQVHVHLPMTERAERTKPSDDPNWVPAVRKVAPKRKGYLTLASSRSYDNEFTLSLAREKCKPDQHVLDPIAYVILNSRSEYQKKRFGNLTDASTCRLICDVFGKQIAVITTNQVDKLEKLGVPELSKFIYQHVDDTLAASKDFPRYLAFGRHIATDHDHPEGTNGILQGLTQHHDLAASLPIKFRFCVSPETLAYARFHSDRYFRERGMPKCDALSKKIPVSKEVDRLRGVIRSSEWFDYIDLDKVGRALHRKAPNDESLRVPYEIVTHLLTPVETQE